MLDVNWTRTVSDFWNWSLQGYESAVGWLFFPLVFVAILGYIYVKTESVVSLSVGIILLMMSFTGYSVFAGVSLLVLFLQIVVTLSIVGLLLLFLSRWRK